MIIDGLSLGSGITSTKIILKATMKAVIRHKSSTSGKETACNQELVTPRLTLGRDCDPMRWKVSMVLILFKMGVQFDFFRNSNCNSRTRKVETGCHL